MKVKEYLEKLEVLSEIYDDLASKDYHNKADIDMASLKMKLIKKEILLMNYLIDKEM